jgi:hypothetical protein
MKNKTNLTFLKASPPGIVFLMLLCLLFSATELTASNLNVSNKQKQSENKVIIAGYVTCRGTGISDVIVESETSVDVSITDREGKYSITVDKGSIVTFKKAGYTPFEHIAVDSQQNLIVCLLLENDSSNNQEADTTKVEKECILNIKTKKEIFD